MVEQTRDLLDRDSLTFMQARDRVAAFPIGASNRAGQRRDPRAIRVRGQQFLEDTDDRRPALSLALGIELKGLVEAEDDVQAVAAVAHLGLVKDGMVTDPF